MPNLQTIMQGEVKFCWQGTLLRDISAKPVGHAKPVGAMLYLSRKIGESVIINNSIELVVIEVRGKTVKLGFNFPPEASVLRKEIYDKIMAENVSAGQGADDGGFFEAEFDLSALDSPKEP